MLIPYKHPSPQSVPVDEGHPSAGEVSAPPASTDSDYMDGSVAGHDGANPGRDQDRDRQCECIEASYQYSSGASGSESENETGIAEGF